MRRKKPSPKTMVTLLMEQDNCCTYCGHKFGTGVFSPKRGLTWLEVNWDHFIPYTWSRKNDEDNWVVSCQICNQLKGSLLFTSIDDARKYLEKKWKDKKLTALPYEDFDEYD